MDTCRRITLGLALAGWSGLWFAEQAQAETASRSAMDARYLLQDNDEYLRSALEAQRLRQLQPGEVIRQPVPPTALPADAACLPVRALRLSGVTRLTPHELSTIHIPHSTCLSAAALQAIIHQINSLYLARGYISARVLPELSGADAMTLRVIEGKVDRIEGASPGVSALFPGMIGRPLNIRDLEQGLDQANRLQSEQMRAEVLPGARMGTSTLRLSEQRDAPWHASVSFDNRGYDATGRRVASVGVSRDNPSGHYDFLSLALAQSLSHARHSRSGSLFYSLPYGYWTLSAFAGQSDYLNTQKLVYHSVALSGFATQGGARLERVLRRTQNQIDSGYLQLTHKRVQNYFFDYLQEINSPTLSVLELGVNRLRLLPSGSLTLEASVEKGLPWFGAHLDWRTPYAGMPHAQFSKANLNLGLRRRLGPARAAMVLDSRFTWQGSRQHLPAIEQIELADPSLVRGFRHNVLAGDTGWAWHNTLSHPMKLGGLSITPRLGLDAGRVLMREGKQNYQNLAGAGIGLSLMYSGALLDLEYSRPLYQPHTFAGEARQILARMSWQF